MLALLEVLADFLGVCRGLMACVERELFRKSRRMVIVKH